MTEQKNEAGRPEKDKAGKGDGIGGLLSGGQATSGQTGAEGSASASLERLSSAFTASARRWELVVYPSLFAFIILAGYGFFLIYNLTKDAHAIRESMVEISRNMDTVSRNMVVMTQVANDQSLTMQQMAHNMKGINFYMGQMRYDLSIMNQNVSRPMSFMNSFLPW